MTDFDRIMGHLMKDNVTNAVKACEDFENALDRRRELFDAAAQHCHCRVREAAAKQLSLCPEKWNIFLNDDSSRVAVAAVLTSADVARAIGFDDVLATLSVLKDRRKSDGQVLGAIGRVLHLLLIAAKEVSSDGQDILYKVSNDRGGIWLKVWYLIDKIVKMRDHGAVGNVAMECAFSLKMICKEFGFERVFAEEKFMGVFKVILLFNRQWRVRKYGVEIIFALGSVCDPKLFGEKVMPYLLLPNQFFQDPCAEIRKYTISGLPCLCARFGPEWVLTELIWCLKRAVSANLNDRRCHEAYILSLSAIAPYLPVEHVSDCVFRPVIKALKFRVDGVKLVAMDIIEKHHKVIHPFLIVNAIKPTLAELTQVTSPTVKARAQRVMQVFP